MKSKGASVKERKRERERGGGNELDEKRRTNRRFGRGGYGETRGAAMQIFAATEIETIRQLESST